MGRRTNSKALESEFTMFDVVYVDGSRTSNRRVLTALLGGLDGDDPALAAIAEQDQAISEKSGKPPLAIETIARSSKAADAAAKDERKGKEERKGKR